jgi:hypothetical protein
MATLRDRYIAALQEGDHKFNFRFKWDWLRLVDITDSRSWEYTATSSPTAIAVDYINGRPVAKMAGTNGAEDAHSFQWGTAAGDGCFQFEADKLTIIRLDVETAHATANVPEFLVGFYAAPTVTAPIANIGSLTDYFLFNKLTAEAGFSIEARKASGTAESTSLAETALAVNTRQQYEIFILPSTTAGAAKVEVWRANNGGEFAPIVGLASNPDLITIATQLPDTVDMTFGLSFEAGDTGTDISYFGGGEVAMLR